MVNVAPRRQRGVCVTCGIRPQMSAGPKRGIERWKRECRTCHKTRHGQRLNPEHAYRHHKTDQCAECGFKGHPCQLDVHHLDGNHGNNDPVNLQTLCANCHRLKHLLHPREDG